MQYRGETALHAACKHGHMDVASLLLHHGAVVNIKDKVRLLCIHGEHGVSQNSVSVWSDVGCHMIVSNYHNSNRSQGHSQNFRHGGK